MQDCSCGVAHDDNSDTCPVSLSQPMIQEALPDLSSKSENKNKSKPKNDRPEELAAAQEAGLVSCAMPSGQLELVPDLEQTVMNPIVSKALERIDRARRVDHFASAGSAAVATAPALETDTEGFALRERDEKMLSSKPKLVVAPALAAATIKMT